MGFLGCSLYSSTITAAMFGIILSIYGVTWTGCLLAFFRGDIPENNFTGPFELISFNNSSTCLVTRDIITTSLVIHVIWFITSALLIHGNRNSIQSLLQIWIAVTTVIVITDASGTGFYIYKAVDALPHYENSTHLTYLMRESAFLPYVIIAGLFSKLATLLLFVLISQMVFVWKRIEAIKEQKDFYMKNHRYSYSSTGSAPSQIADQQRVIYSSKELLPPAYTTHSLEHKRRAGSPLQDSRYKYPAIPTPQRSDSLKPHYGLDNFGFAIPHLPHVGVHSTTGRVVEPEIDYEYNKVASHLSRDYRY